MIHHTKSLGNYRIHMYSLFIYLCFNGVLASAQDSLKLDIESITNKTFDSKRNISTTWLKEEVGYVQFENKNKELIRYNPSTGERTVLVSIENIVDTSQKQI